jgi:hypothetical protein
MLVPSASTPYLEAGPNTGGKKSRSLLSMLKRKTSRVNVRPGSSGADDGADIYYHFLAIINEFTVDGYNSWSQSTLHLAGPSTAPSNGLPPSPTTNSSNQKKTRKPSRARAQPQPVPEFTLDTNLDEMDGIIARPVPQNQYQYKQPPWRDDGSDGSHIGGHNIVGTTGMAGVQSPTAAFFTDPFSAFPSTPSSGGVPKPLPEPPLQANGHRPGSPTAGVGPTNGKHVCWSGWQDTD